MTCEVCEAPALPLGGACVFCRSPLTGPPDPAGLLDYLARRLPAAGRRRGPFGRGAVRDLQIRTGNGPYRARRRRSGLSLSPPVEPARWADRLLTDLSRDAASDPEVRAAVTRAGWALR